MRSLLESRGVQAAAVIALGHCIGSCASAAEALTAPVVELPSEPLSSIASRVDPNMVLDLALEFSNTGAAYRGSFDWKKVYHGYWDPMACYGYAAADGYFKRLAPATRLAGGAIACPNQWSGNLLNWAATSALDGLRLALTGGDRVADETDRTVLQRAVLQQDFYRASHFPDKTITGNLDKLTPLVTGNGTGVRAAGTLHFSSCLDRIFIGPSASGSCANPGTDQQYGPGAASAPYFARVEVCTAAEAATRGDLCFKYPSGHFKPVGEIQRHADRLRFAVFGYLLDNDPDRYGGVLRAPMKYAGPKKLEANLDRVDNLQTEWNASTGVFLDDPVPTVQGTRFSGVINSLNRFGRAGAYKKFDPAGELYYESLRYLQGKVPTRDAMAGIGAVDDPRKDGLPVYNDTAQWRTDGHKSWDPVGAGCRKNYILAIGDLETHGDRSLPGLPGGGRSFSNASFEPDTSYWTRLVGAFENRESLAYTHPSGKDGLATTGNHGLPAFNYKGGAQLTAGTIAGAETGGDKGSFGIAGLAYWANTQKIRADFPDVRVQTFGIDLDAGGQGVIRQGQRGSALYLASKYGGFDDGNADGNPFRASGGIGRPDAAGNAEWAEGIDGDGQPKPSNYFLAGEPRQLLGAIHRIFESAAAPSGGSTADAAISSDRIGAAGSSLYVSRFAGRRWSGTLLSYSLAYDEASGAVRQADDPAWDAGALLTGNATAQPAMAAREPSDRSIFTLSSAGLGTPFRWEALDNVQRGQLNATSYAVPMASDLPGSDRVAYLRGDRRRELSAPGGIFRVRDSVMGDVANSNPLFAGPPSSRVQGPGYGQFLEAHKARSQTVYVGANDGMLHAFSAATGSELFAYVPRAVFPKLSDYTSPDYVHQSYVDGSPAAAEARMADGTWKTVLVSGTGAGATGVFALDVSDPAAFSADKVLWEFTGLDDSDMGHVFQAPRIMKFRTAAPTRTGAAAYGWFAVVPSGFNHANPDQRAALFLLSLDKPAGAAWKRSINYHKIVLPAPADRALVNALGVPGDFAAAEGWARWLYAGDTQGNLWKFDFTGNAPWSEDNALGLKGLPLMVATSGGANAKRQPITVVPEVGAGPNGGAIVLFGTGKFVTAEDIGHLSQSVQTLYGVYDAGTAIPAREARTQLQARTAVATSGQALPAIVGEPFVYGTGTRSNASRRGWYFDLPGSEESGERQVSRLALSDGYLFFNTLIPNGKACGANGGGRSCAVNAWTGLSQGGTCVPSSVGPLSSPLLVELGEGAYSATDAFGRRSETKKLSVVNVGSRGGSGRAGISTVQPVEGGRVSQMAGRLNWRQVVDFQEAKP
ncbi:type IV pilus assembly protein PilY1 [Variovorax paradoxus]|uniref:pilus assembly protein n=1 Tax=Variovorax paradoxus TaxID=34073 RepID=UPI002792ADA3|nr:PilC/PilY family type IV pilus protein [Variovorax paradoxus]MDQ0569728.1 type IV pilus assembly protein PilY1 [Variovorax paradoxus]